MLQLCCICSECNEGCGPLHSEMNCRIRAFIVLCLKGNAYAHVETERDVKMHLRADEQLRKFNDVRHASFVGDQVLCGAAHFHFWSCSPVLPMSGLGAGAAAVRVSVAIVWL